MSKVGMPKANGVTMSNQVALPTLSKFILPIADGHHAAGDDAQQHRDVGDEALAVLDQQQHDDEHEGGDRQVVERAVVRVVDHRDRPRQLDRRRRGAGAAEAAAAAAPALTLSTIATSLGTSGDCARKAGPPIAQPTPTRIRLMPMMAMMVPVTTGGKKRSIRLTTRRDDHRDDAGADDGAEERTRAVDAGHRVGERHHRPDRGEGHAHHHRQLDAEVLRDAERLDQRDDAAGEQVGRDQQRHLLGRELERAADDQRHGDGAGIHHQHVLQAERASGARGAASRPPGGLRLRSWLSSPGSVRGRVGLRAYSPSRLR